MRHLIKKKATIALAEMLQQLKDIADSARSHGDLNTESTIVGGIRHLVAAHSLLTRRLIMEDKVQNASVGDRGHLRLLAPDSKKEGA